MSELYPPPDTLFLRDGGGSSLRQETIDFALAAASDQAQSANVAHAKYFDWEWPKNNLLLNLQRKVFEQDAYPITQRHNEIYREFRKKHADAKMDAWVTFCASDGSEDSKSRLWEIWDRASADFNADNAAECARFNTAMATAFLKAAQIDTMAVLRQKLRGLDAVADRTMRGPEAASDAPDEDSNKPWQP